jgi:hypothetical protein
MLTLSLRPYPLMTRWVFDPDIALQTKEAANELYSKRNFQGAVSKYNAILDQFSQSNLPVFLRAVRSNRAACLIELGLFDFILIFPKRQLPTNSWVQVDTRMPFGTFKT